MAGIFVGGKGLRMNGQAKGLLRVNGISIVEHWCTLLRPFAVDVVLVGVRPEYASLGLRILPDRVANCGPMGGLAALLEAAQGAVLALGGDMPYVTGAMLEALIQEPSDALVVAPKRDGQWEPLFSRVRANAKDFVVDCLKRRELSLQKLFDSLHAHPLNLNHDEEICLHDWDSPEDIQQ